MPRLITFILILTVAVLSGCRDITPAAASPRASNISPGLPNQGTIDELSAVRRENTTPSSWVLQHTPHAITAIVFVHGLFGDTLGTWANQDTGKHFYDLLGADPKFKGQIDLFAFGFPSFVFKKGSFTITEAANALHSQLQYHDVFDYRRVVFVAHSMGGLVVLQMLLTNRDVLPQTPLVVLFATPQEGAQISTIARRLVKNPAIAEMVPIDANDYLQRLNDEWRSIKSTSRPHISCAYEKLPIGDITIVPWSSATRFCDDAANAVLANHIDIVKPASPDAESYQALANALSQYSNPNDYSLKGESVPSESKSTQRHLSDSQKALLRENLNPIAKDLKPLLIFADDLRGSTIYANDFVKFFRTLGIEAYGPNLGGTVSEVDHGVMVGLKDPDHPSELSTRFINALRSAGLDVNTTQWESGAVSPGQVDFDLFICEP